IHRAHLFKEFNNITAVIYKEFSHFFIEYLLIIYIKYIYFEYKILNFILFNKLLNNFIKR
ncbi:hypothetical protein EMPG_10119, partial [Blastomyces silverae]